MVLQDDTVIGKAIIDGEAYQIQGNVNKKLSSSG